MRIKIFLSTLVLIIQSYQFTTAQEPVLMDGFPIIIHESTFLTAFKQGITIMDVTGDGNSELIFSISNKVFIYDYLGNPFPGWPYISEENEYFTNTPAVGDIDGDGAVEIVASSVALETYSDKVLALNLDGSIVENFPIMTLGGAGHLTLYDLDHDDDLEIIYGGIQLSPDTTWTINVFRGDGSLFPGWPVAGIYPGDFAIGDIDNDSQPEIVVSGWTNDAEHLWAFEADASLMAGFPVSMGYDFAGAGPPVLFDADGNGFLEIGLLFRDWVSYDGGLLAVFDYQGNILNGWPLTVDSCPVAGVSPVFCRLRSELLFSFGGMEPDNAYLTDYYGEIIPYWPVDMGDSNDIAVNYDQPTIGDIDNDGSVDFLFNLNMAVLDSNGIWRGRVNAYNYYGEELEYFPLMVPGGTFPGGISLGDIDNDGIVEMVFQTDYPTSGRPIQRIFVYKLTGVPYIEERFPWPMSCHDPQHTNNLNFRMPTSVNDGKTPNLPSAITLTNYPNPFNSSTVIEYAVEEKGEVQLEIYNLLGQRVSILVDDEVLTGKHSVRWNADRFSSGIYFSVLKTGDVKHTRRMVLLK
ncbi:MAG: T9SS type A sorting domain-containing protein [candidate division Zixibacteria bacterium]|nr:T9SS type A sorting domain-containing protein [candidate division Zixibacteria bacterium]